jgi:hypothetical protein
VLGIQKKTAPVQHPGQLVGDRDAVQFFLHVIAVIEFLCVFPGVAIQSGAVTHGLHDAVSVKFRDVILFTLDQEQQGAICQQKRLNHRASQFQDRRRIGRLQQIVSQRKQAHRGKGVSRNRSCG